MIANSNDKNQHRNSNDNKKSSQTMIMSLRFIMIIEGILEV